MKSSSSLCFRAAKAALALVGAALLVPQAAHADARDFPFTYEWRQSPKGSYEVELKNTYYTNENEFKQELELEYQISDRWLVAPYIIAEKNPEHSYKYQGFKLESRYQLNTHYKPGKFLTGVYLEYENEREEAQELEGKIIVSRYGKDGSNLSMNLIHARQIEEAKEKETLFSAGYAQDVKGLKGVRPGVEYIHNFTEHLDQVGPTASFHLGTHVQVTAGVAIPVNKRDEGNSTDYRLNAQYEF